MPTVNFSSLKISEEEPAAADASGSHGLNCPLERFPCDLLVGA